MRGPEYDVTSKPLDHEVVRISGGGRKHGKEAIGGGMFPRSSHRTLPEYKARSGISTSSICQCSTPAMVAMESRLEEQRRLLDEKLEERLAEERRLADQRMQQYFAMFAAYCTQNGMPAMQMPDIASPPMHQSGHGSNNDGSSHAPGPNANDHGGSPNL